MICPECHLGRLGTAQLPYLHQLGRHILIAQHVPALICDVCGHTDYEPEYLQNLQRLIKLQTGPRDGRSAPRRPPSSPSSSGWPRARRSR